MQRFLHPSLVAAVLLLAGCTPFVRKPIEPAATARDFDSRRLSRGIRKWTLPRLVAEALQKNPDLAVLRAKVQSAEAALRTAGERPNPVLGIRPGFNSTTRGISPWILEPTLDWTIEMAGKRGARMAEARAKVRVARLDLAAAEWRVRSEIRRALLAMYAAQLTRGEYQGQITVQAESAALLESQLKAGAARPQDVAVARIPLNQTRLAMHDTELTALRARAQLAAAVGVPAAALQGAAFDFAEVSRLPASPPGRRARRAALEHRADILAGLADYAGSEERVRLEVARQYPDLKLSPGYQLDQTENKWSLGFAVELPILHQHGGAIAEAEGRRAEAAARFLATQARILGEIDLALVLYQSARAKAAAAEALATDVGAQTKAAETMKAAGEISQLDVTQRRVEQGAADLSRAQAQVQALEALAALEDALQTPVSRWP
jgi:cobalt-zinc-cadmium efflux system outer membrane protein